MSASIDPTLSSIQPANSQVKVDATQSALSQGGSSDPATMTIASMDDFKKKYPELYKTMMDSMAQEMIRQNQRANERFVQKLKEQRYNG